MFVCMVYACMYVSTCVGGEHDLCVCMCVCLEVFRLHISTYKLSSLALVDYFQAYLCDVDFLPREHLIPHPLHTTSLSLTTEREE